MSSWAAVSDPNGLQGSPRGQVSSKAPAAPSQQGNSSPEFSLLPGARGVGVHHLNGLAKLQLPDKSGIQDWRGDKRWKAMTSVFFLKRRSLLQEKFYRNQRQ